MKIAMPETVGRWAWERMPAPVAERANDAMFATLERAMARAVCVASHAWPDFAKRLAEKDVHFVMNTAKGPPEGWFTIKGGKVGLKFHSTRPADFTLTWKTAEVGWRTMMSMATGDPKALSKAVMAGELSLAGDAGNIGWFMGVLNHMSKCFMKRGREGALELWGKVPGSAALASLPVPPLPVVGRARR